MSQPQKLECCFCNAKTTFESAAADGWEPSFWISDPDSGQDEESGMMCCPGCSEVYLVRDEEDGEMVVRKGFEYLAICSQAYKRQD